MKQVNLALPREFFLNEEDITGTATVLARMFQSIATFWGDIHDRHRIVFVFFATNPSGILDTLRQRQDCATMLESMEVAVNDDANDGWHVVWPLP